MIRKKSKTKNEKTQVKTKVKKGFPLSFYKKEIVTTVTEIDEGIAVFCCKEMEEACSEYKKDGEIYYSAIYDKYKKKLGINTHHCYSYEDYHTDFKEFKYCPFCGTKINGYVEIEK